MAAATFSPHTRDTPDLLTTSITLLPWAFFLYLFFEYLNISFALGCLHDSSNDSYISSFNILSFICFTDTNSRSSVWQNFVTNYFLAHLKYLATIATKSSNNTPLCFHNSLAVLTNLAIYLLLNFVKIIHTTWILTMHMLNTHIKIMIHLITLIFHHYVKTASNIASVLLIVLIKQEKKEDNPTFWNEMIGLKLP